MFVPPLIIPPRPDIDDDAKIDVSNIYDDKTMLGVGIGFAVLFIIIAAMMWAHFH